jgi:putative chitinase
MQLTLEQLEQMVPAASDKKRLLFLMPINYTLREFHINTRLRVAAFMAQITHESGSLHYVEEIADGTAYNNRSDLGNTRPEAIEIARLHDIPVGTLYKGHGLIQITGYDNHWKVGEALGIAAAYEPKLLCKPQYAARSAGWFWNKHGCNYLADQDRFTAITKTINGGLNGQEERLALYRNNLKVLDNE